MALVEEDTVGRVIALVDTFIYDLREDSGRGKSREVSLAITKLEEARMWLEQSRKGA